MLNLLTRIEDAELMTGGRIFRVVDAEGLRDDRSSLNAAPRLGFTAARVVEDVRVIDRPV